MYSLIEKQMQSLNLQPGLVFSTYFDKEEIILKTKELHIEAPIFLAKGELYNIENSYFRSPLWQTDIIAIGTDQYNSITYLEPLWIFINDLKEGHLDIKAKPFR